MSGRYRNRISLLTVLIAGFVMAPSVNSAKMDDDQPYAPGRLLVKFRNGVTNEKKKDVLDKHNAKVEAELGGIGVDIVSLPSGLSEKELEKLLKKQDEVEFAELDYLVAPDAVTPNDPLYSSQWHLPRIAAPDAWSQTSGAPSVVVAVLDTGVDPTHPDLAGKLVPGWNFYDNNADSSDVYGHGTKVAGTIAAMANNGKGVASVCWGCGIMALRVSRPDGYAFWSTIATALRWAADNGARVANISYAISTSSTVTSAAQYFYNAGGITASSAGNDGTFLSNPDNPYIVTVGATDENDNLYSWSNTGNIIDVVAPGCVTTTLNGGGYGGGCGTSYSSPVTAGVAALVLSMNSGLSASKVVDVLKQSADGGGSWNSTIGWGRVNAAQAVAMVAIGDEGKQTPDTTAPTVQITSPANGATVSGTVAVQVTASDNKGVTSVSLFINGAPAGTVTTAPYSFNWDSKQVSNGTVVLEARASDAAGNTSSHQVSVSVNNVAPDTTAPTVQITSPANGATVSGTVAVQVTASDNKGVTSVSLYVDGSLAGTVTKAPYSFSWEAKKTSNGNHVLEARASDAAGNTSSHQVSVTVDKRGGGRSAVKRADYSTSELNSRIRYDLGARTSER